MKKLRVFLIALAILVLSTQSKANDVNAIDLSSREKSCLATAIYHESRGESDKGMFDVASVILNRITHPKFPDDACSVIKQKGQFTYDHSAKIREWGIYNKVQSVVDAISEGFRPTHQFIYFHSVKVKGPCTNKKRKMKSGNHVFCS